MEENLIERCYYTLNGLSKELFAEEVLPEKEPQYTQVCLLLANVMSTELSTKKDNLLVSKLRTFLKYGTTWEEVYPLVSKDIRKYQALIDTITSLLKTKINLQNKEETSLFNLDLNLEAGMELYKVIIHGFENEVDIKKSFSVNISNEKIDSPKARFGDPRVYLHNPFRDGIVFAKKRFLAERFPESLIPFMRILKLKLYTCSVKFMLSYIAKKYGTSGKLNLIAISKKMYLENLDDRTLFIVLERKEDQYVPLEIFYGELSNRVPLVQMQTFAFCAGIKPDELMILEFGNQSKIEETSKYIIEPDSLTLVGWWNKVFESLAIVYMEQNLRIVLSDFIYYAVDVFIKNNLSNTEKESKINIFKEFLKKTINLERLESENTFNFDLKSTFFSFLQNNVGENYTDNYKKTLALNLIQMVTLTLFDQDLKRNEEAMQRELQVICRELRLNQEEINELYDKFNKLIVREQRTLFVKEEYGRVKGLLIKVEPLVEKSKKSIKEITDKIFNRSFNIEIGKIRMQSFLPLSRTPVEFQIRELIRRGAKTFIFYGTCGGVKNISEETLVIPKVVYVYPRLYYRIHPELYVPMAIENVLTSNNSAKNYFNTDNFPKTEHIFVAATYQEHSRFLEKLKDYFSKENSEVTIDMDVGPIAEVCFEQNVGFGSILYVTDVVGGADQRQERKNFYMRQLLISFFRNYGGKDIKINEQEIELLLNPEFKKIVKLIITDFLLN